MRTTLLLLLTIAVGATLGAGMAVLRVAWVPWRGYLIGGSDDPQAVVARPSQGVAKVAVEQTEFHFGTMDIKAQESHRFAFHSRGTADLELLAGVTSCGCTGLEVPGGATPPGRSASVEVRWRSKDAVGTYEETATVLTNDPERPRIKLRILGKITAAIQAIPAEVTFANLTTSGSGTAEVLVYAYRAGNLRLEGAELGDRSTADKFAVEQFPLSGRELRQNPAARSGIRLRITAKSGLPLGPIRQTISFRTNLPDYPRLALPIEGLVTGDIALFGAGWDRERQVLNLGAVDRHGIQRSLVIIARGVQRKEVQFKVVRVRPAWLEAMLRPAAGGGAVGRVELSIRIPAGVRPANYLGPDPEGMGQILLETSHPHVPQLRLWVSFSVDQS